MRANQFFMYKPAPVPVGQAYVQHTAHYAALAGYGVPSYQALWIGDKRVRLPFKRLMGQREFYGINTDLLARN